MDFIPSKSNSKYLFCRFNSLFQDESACCIQYLQHVQSVIQTREAVYLPKYSPVTASWYPIPNGQYIYPFTMYCVLNDHATMSSISKKHIKPPKQSIYIHFSKIYIGLHFFQVMTWKWPIWF